MAAIYEDNFGFWELDCLEEHALFAHVQSFPTLTRPQSRRPSRR